MKAVFCLLACLLVSACSPDESGPTPLPDGEINRPLEASLWLSACSGSGILFEYYAALLPAADIEPIIDCVLAAEGCVAINACVGTTDTECGDEYAESCDGDVLVVCESLSDRLTETRVDCAANPHGNTQCHQVDGYAQCASPEPCDTPFAESCDGDRVRVCVDGRFEFTDCARDGRTCGMIDDFATCIVSEEPCEACDGDVAQRCDQGVIRDRVDCAPLGQTCNPGFVDGSTLPCRAVEPECEAGPAECNGAVARTCLGGEWFEADCGLIGATCAVVNGESRCRFEE